MNRWLFVCVLVLVFLAGFVVGAAANAPFSTEDEWRDDDWKDSGV